MLFKGLFLLFLGAAATTSGHLYTGADSYRLSDKSSWEDVLIEDLLRGYNELILPVSNASQAVKVI